MDGVIVDEKVADFIPQTWERKAMHLRFLSLPMLSEQKVTSGTHQDLPHQGQAVHSQCQVSGTVDIGGGTVQSRADTWSFTASTRSETLAAYIRRAIQKVEPHG